MYGCKPYLSRILPPDEYSGAVGEGIARQRKIYMHKSRYVNCKWDTALFIWDNFSSFPFQSSEWIRRNPLRMSAPAATFVRLFNFEYSDSFAIWKRANAKIIILFMSIDTETRHLHMHE